LTKIDKLSEALIGPTATIPYPDALVPVIFVSG